MIKLAAGDVHKAQLGQGSTVQFREREPHRVRIKDVQSRPQFEVYKRLSQVRLL
jgi:hypothetical protein